MQTKSQAPPWQTEEAFAGGVQERQLDPHCVVLLSETHWPPQSWKPELHTQPQDTPLQVAVELAGPRGHAVHEVPQVNGELSSAQDEPQRWKPKLQLKSQLVPLQVELAFDGGTHGVHDAPQLPTS